MEDREHCGEAVHLKGASHCRITNSHFAAVGGNAVYLEDDNIRNAIQGNRIEYAGHCGVVLLGRREDQHGPHMPVVNEIVDNAIHHCGVFDKVATGVFCGVSTMNVIGHNLIEHVPHHAINLGNSGYGRNIVEYNRVRHSCQETGDNAAINCWMEDDHVRPDAIRSGHAFCYRSQTSTCLSGCVSRTFWTKAGRAPPTPSERAGRSCDGVDVAAGRTDRCDEAVRTPHSGCRPPQTPPGECGPHPCHPSDTPRRRAP